ncbi:MAG: glycosyltransferase 87 family protein [Hyphomicrobiaceae bacterium]
MIRTGGAAPFLVALASALVPIVAFGASEVASGALGSYVASALAHGALYVGAIVYVIRRPARGFDLLLILCIAVFLRALAMTAPANLTTDGLRYVWDGRIQWAGFNPYLWVPADAELAHLRDAVIYPGINQKETAVTLYPPLAEMLFALANRLSDSLRGIQLVMALAEGVTIIALLAWLKADNLPRERVLIYAWHPLPIWEFSSMGHIDSAATALLMLTILAVVRQRQGLAGGLLAAAFATKYFPLVLAPALWRRGSWRMPLAFAVMLAALYMPYAWGAGWNVVGFLARHLDNEGYGAGYGFHIVWVLRDFGLWAPSGRVYVAIVLVPLAALGVWSLLRRRFDEVRPDHLVILAAAFTLATSPHYAWYFGWLIPLLVRHLSPAVLGFTLLALLQNMPGNAQWATATFFYITIFGGFVLLATAEALWRSGSRH